MWQAEGVDWTLGDTINLSPVDSPTINSLGFKGTSLCPPAAVWDWGGKESKRNQNKQGNNIYLCKRQRLSDAIQQQGRGDAALSVWAGVLVHLCPVVFSDVTLCLSFCAFRAQGQSRRRKHALPLMTWISALSLLEEKEACRGALCFRRIRVTELRLSADMNLSTKHPAQQDNATFHSKEQKQKLDVSPACIKLIPAGA